jgi:hypothetical protein
MRLCLILIDLLTSISYFTRWFLLDVGKSPSEISILLEELESGDSLPSEVDKDVWHG